MAAMEVDELPALTSAANPAQEEESSEGEIPEDEYEIEAILSHEVGHFPGKKATHEIAYLVSWKGYGAEHNSWVEERDAENASEMINKYWSTADKTGVASKADGSGWTGAKSHKTKRALKKESPDTASASTSTGVARGKRTGRTVAQEEQLAKKRLKTAAQTSYTRAGIEISDVSAIDEEEDLSERQIKRLKPEDQARAKRRMYSRKYLSMPDWEQIIKHVESMERTENGKLIAFVIFENGERFAFEASTVNHRCPQKVIAFYESRLRFKPEAANLPPLTLASATSQPPQQPARGDESDAVEAEEEATEEQGEPEAEGEGEREGEGEGAETLMEDVVPESRDLAAMQGEDIVEAQEETASIAQNSDAVVSSGREEGELSSQT